MEHARIVGPVVLGNRLRSLQKHHDPDVLRLRSLLRRRTADFMGAQEDAAAAMHFERAIARTSAEFRAATHAAKEEQQLISDSLFQESIESLRSVSLLDAGNRLSGVSLDLAKGESDGRDSAALLTGRDGLGRESHMSTAS